MYELPLQCFHTDVKPVTKFCSNTTSHDIILTFPDSLSDGRNNVQVTNCNNYLLLASSNVSIFFVKGFVAKTNLRSVPPGESFQMFLGVDPAVKVRPRWVHQLVFWILRWVSHGECPSFCLATTLYNLRCDEITPSR